MTTQHVDPVEDHTWADLIDQIIHGRVLERAECCRDATTELIADRSSRRELT